jgi:hypothetical protein
MNDVQPLRRLKCRVCGAELRAPVTDTPPKTGSKKVVILKDLPLLQGDNCGEYLREGRRDAASGNHAGSGKPAGGARNFAARRVIADCQEVLKTLWYEI